ncbi:MAG: hypothetical protein IPL49_03770 [Saprospirales bacterium]|nr:hypothetical protein [Saprospirales bacterium]
MGPTGLQSQVPWEKLPAADAHYQAGEYEKALENYRPVLVFYNEKKTLVKAARCAAQLGINKEALGYLKRAISLGWNNPQTLLYDRELEPLKKEAKFNQLVSRIEAFEARRAAINKPELLAELEAIYADDQKFRKQKGREKEQAQLDSINLVRIEKLIHQHGWLGSNLLSGRNYCWVAIQHQPLEVQKKYVGRMARAVKKGEEDPAYLAFLQDQILVAQGKGQKYGTQVDFENKRLYPIDDREKVDIYRAQMGLGSIQTLLDRYKID